jgi:hypothetical protein
MYVGAYSETLLCWQRQLRYVDTSKQVSGVASLTTKQHHDIPQCDEVDVCDSLADHAS